MWKRLTGWVRDHLGEPMGPTRFFRGPRFVIHKRYLLDLPFRQYDARRPFRILAYLERRKLLRRGFLRRPRPASLRRLQKIHDADYLRSLEAPGALESIVGFPLDLSDQDKFLCFQRLMCGGTVDAMRNAAAHRGVAVNLGGGFHHAAPGAGSGFCVFNDVALAIRLLRERGFNSSILVIDLDLHDGDGTRKFFANDPTVHTFSIHNRTLGSSRAIASTCVELGTDVDDEQYLAALRDHLPRVMAEVAPGFVFYLAGSDPAVEDELGDWRISLQGMLDRDRFVMKQLPPRTPCVILLAGGYGSQAWRHGAAFLSWLLSGNAVLDVPLELELPVDHYRRLTRWMKVPHLLPEEKDSTEQGPSSENDWGLSDGDLGMDGARRPQRFLGLFSRHAIELALEESGVLNRLRRRGYRGLRVALEMTDPSGDLLRILSIGESSRVLVEIRLRIDRSTDPGRTWLAVEWLLIQDVGYSYEMSRPLLPGQRYPGMGLLRDATAMLIVLCERLELDGLLFTPSHFHLANLARPLAQARVPQEEGRFQAVQHAVRNLRSREAAEAIEAGCLRDTISGQPFPWEPVPLIAPVSRRAHAHFLSQDYRSAVARARAECELELVDPI